MRHICLITTGGTIEKTFCETTGTLENRRSILTRMIRRLRLHDTVINTVELMSKDSKLLTDADRERIADTVRAVGGSPDRATDTTGIVVLHGTDTLDLTGEHLLRTIPAPRVPIILTGAMRPFEMKHADALQNLTESIFAAGVLPPGVYCVFHSRALAFPGVVKDRQRGTFVKPG